MADKALVLEEQAREQLGQRDPDDWPILATALAFASPIWTEDTDFFGCGVATWTTASVNSFFRNWPTPTPPTS